MKSREFAVPTIKRQKRRRQTSEINDARNQRKQTFMTLDDNVYNKKEADDCDLYGQLLAKKLRNYSMHERHLLMHDIDGLLLKKLPGSAISSFSSYTSTLSPKSLHAPVSINTLNEPTSTASYTTMLSSKSPLRVNIFSRPSSTTKLNPRSILKKQSSLGKVI